MYVDGKRQRKKETERVTEKEGGKERDKGKRIDNKVK